MDILFAFQVTAHVALLVLYFTLQSSWWTKEATTKLYQ